jgi:hypothetical protein
MTVTHLRPGHTIDQAGQTRPSELPKIPLVKSEPLTIDGVAGPIVVTTPTLWGKPSIMVGGQPAARTGSRRYILPATAGGTVDAALRTGFADPYPSVEVNGVRHRTGPKVSVVLRALTLLPILLVAGGALGGLIGALGVVTNMAVARTQISSVAKAPIMIGVVAVALLVWLAVVAAIS